MTPERVKKIRDVLSKRQPDLTILTDSVHKPHNLSAIIRSCDAFAVPDVHVVWPHHQYRTFRGRAMGSQQFVTTHTHDKVEDGINHLKKQGFQIVAAHFSDRAVPHYDIDYTQPTAIVMGAEKHGISEAAASMADHHVLVPMEGMVQSLNVSVAAALILSEACRQRTEKGMIGNNPLNEDTYQKLFFEWCYPDLARLCQKKKLPYPEINEDGDFLDPGGFSAAYNQASASSKKDSMA